MKKLLLTLLFICAVTLHAQKWIDTLYTYTKTTVNYGKAVDFAGNNRILNMDICVPNNDQVPICGRPLLVVIHGGAFMAGSKEDYDIQQWMKDYAKRGYVTASINYRLGQFQTSNAVHCNVTQLFNVAWDCSNMADTAEWYRACYRGIQDAKGAIRYLILNKSKYKIDSRNVFLAGESAGGFIALGAAFLDTAAEKSPLCNSIASVTAPNAIYDNACVKQYGWDTSIASMRLTRPDLGPVAGTLNDSAGAYTIKGVGNFFGGVFPGWFSYNTNPKPPAIYMYHQPNDLIVPYKTNKVLKGFSDCFTGLGCASIINNPWLHGSAGVRNQIASLKVSGKPASKYWFDSTLNNADCTAQGFNPGLTGHSIDNYGLRTLHMAQYFAPLIDTTQNCSAGLIERNYFSSSIEIYPNPFQDEINISTSLNSGIKGIQLFDLTGRSIEITIVQNSVTDYLVQFNRELKCGIYFIGISDTQGTAIYKKLIKTNN